MIQEDEAKMKTMKKQEISEELPDMTVHEYTRPNKPIMPESAAKYSPLPLKNLCRQVISAKRARESDFQFMKDIITKPGTPEFGGYNTQLAKRTGTQY